MKLPKTKIWECVSKDKDSRPTLANVHYNAGKGRLEAADGFILAVCPVTLEEGEEAGNGGIVPLDAIKEAAKLGNAKGRTPVLREEGGNYTAGAVSAYPDGDPEVRGATREAVEVNGHGYPDVDQIIPSGDNFKYNYEKVMTIDARLLWRLAQAICEDANNLGTPGHYHVQLYASNNSKSAPIVVRPFTKGGQFLTGDHLGLIMPVSDES